MSERRIVITGIGVLTPIGHGKEGFFSGLKEGKSGVQTIDRFDTSQIPVKVAGQINDFDPGNYFDARQTKRMDRFAQLALVAAGMAIDDARLEYDQKRPDPRSGVCMGTALGGVSGAEKEHEAYVSSGLRAVNPSLALTVFGGAGGTNIAIQFGFAGPSNANSNSCSSGTMAVGEGFRYIKEGYADVMIVGGTEAPLYELTFSAFAIIRAMSTNNDPATACRPFDKERDGFVMGEAAAVLVLEEFERARKRGAKIYGEVLGYACNNDAYHMVAPRPTAECAERAMRDALYQACLSPADIGYINAHASSTQLNDKTETLAIRHVFGDGAKRIPVSGTKSMTAHALGATGAVEAVICALALDRDYLPPTIHYSTPDPNCDLDCIPNTGRHQRVDYILSNSFGFGGINATLVFGRVDQ